MLSFIKEKISVERGAWSVESLDSKLPTPRSQHVLITFALN